MSSLQKIYDNSPIVIQNLMCSVKGLQNQKQRYGNVYYEERKFLEDFDNWSLQKKLDFNFKELVNFINFAYQKTNFYHKAYRGINLNHINDYDDLKKLPVITKETIRKHSAEFVPDINEKMVEAHTGGTTGKSLIVNHTITDTMKRMALLDHFKHRVGFENRIMKRATFNGKHIVPSGQKKNIYWRYNSSCKQMIYSSFAITEDTVPYYVESLNKFAPASIDGFFTCIVDVASYILWKNIRLNFEPIAVFPTSETLTEEGRVIIEKAFGCPVYNQYASSEGAPFITECVNHNLHVELSSGWFENYNNSDEVLVTSFHTHGTPLIRYQIGDSVKFSSDGDCACNNKTIMATDITGRKLDYLFTAKGAKINGGNISNIFKNLPNSIIKAQFVQKVMEEIHLSIVVDDVRFQKEHEKILFEEFAHKFGTDTKLIINYVDDIPREKSGKFKMIVNRVSL